MTTTLGLGLDPLDVLFFRDGRPFTGAEQSVSGLPLPQTFAGAIRTALLRSIGCDFDVFGQVVLTGVPFGEAVCGACAREHHWIGGVAVRGPWLARYTTSGFEICLTVPATLQREKAGRGGALSRLTPLPAGQLPGWSPPEDQQGLRPLWLKRLEPTEPASGYLAHAGLERFLRGDEVAANDIVPASELFDMDYRTGISISPDRLVVEKSQLFGRGFLALKQGVFLYGELLLPEGAPDSLWFDAIELLPFGGEGRHVSLRRFDQPFSWPSADPRGGKEKPFLFMTTPCAFAAGWKPQSVDGHLTAAAVPGSVAFSGWDMARRGPKQTRFAVQAGSVYFLESLPDGLTDSLAETTEEQQQGWGCYLKGMWNDE